MKKLLIMLALCATLFSCQKTNLVDELPSTESFAKKPKATTWSEPIRNLVVFDSCRNEQVFVTGTQSYSLTEYPGYIDYIIWLDIDDAWGEFSGIHYRGKGKIEGKVVYNDEGDVKGKTTYRVKYHGDKGAQLSFWQHALFIQKNGEIKVEFNNINDRCK